MTKKKVNTNTYHLLHEADKSKTMCGRQVAGDGGKRPQVLLTATLDRKSGKVCGKCQAFKEGKPAMKKQRQPGVCALIAQRLTEGVATVEIVIELRERFPHSMAGPTTVSWVRSALKGGRVFAS